MQTKLKVTTVLFCGFVLLGGAGCGGSSGTARIIDLEDKLEAEKEARAEAERQAQEAERKRREEEQARREAEAGEQDAETQRQEEEQRRLAAERERQRLADEAEKARQATSRAEARVARAGLASTTAAGTVTAVTPKYGSTTSLTATAGGSPVSLQSSRISSLGVWSGTALSSTGHDLVVYSNIGPATRVLLTQQYGSGSTPAFTDSEPTVSGTIMTVEIDPTRDGGNEGRRIRSGSFPTTDGEDKTFPFNYDTVSDTDTDTDPDKVRIGGTFHGASGHFECSAAQCTIGKRGDRFIVVAGPWNFLAADTARALVDDESYMYFGWWKHEMSDGSLAFARFSGGVNSATTGGGTSFDALGGSATYRGPAAGQYALEQPAGSESGAGSFTASAELTANFAANSLSGTVTNFSNASDWTLTLNAASMAGGNVEAADGGTVTWEIGDATSQQPGAWIAELFSEAPYVGQIPDGVAGTFNAQFDNVGQLIGAFGARK